MVIGIEAASEGSWQQRVILASRYIGLDESSFEEAASKNDAAISLELFGPIDNTSHQCSGYFSATAAEGGFCLPCPDDKPLWWLVLRWLKMMLFKIARSYHAKPLLLIIAPLAVGLCIGFFMGRRQTHQPKQTNGSRQNGSVFLPILYILRDLVSIICFRLHSWFGEKLPPLARDGETQISQRQTKEIGLKDSHEDLSRSPNEVTLTKDELVEKDREDGVRTNLKGDADTQRESEVHVSMVPQHVAVIMDGNRRYGKAKYGNVSKGHWDGSSKLVEFAKWCIAEKVSVLTVYAFSTENWNRDPAEVASLMAIFAKYSNELRVEALKRNIKMLVLSTDYDRIPAHVKNGLRRMVDETQKCTGLTMNICMSYGSRGEIVNASRSLAVDAARGALDAERIDENEFEKRLLTSHCGDPDVLLRTSGEIRISNFLLWQLAYTEMFFVDKPWPAVEKNDLLEVIRTYAKGRIRRFGK